ncbi:hypothetical protein [Tropicimonas isoalkanivorans]|uniref:Uncharacterized protein n=1 Tax=Tropicimonas isoalkanivorans TaxID=441112 RepID=A0A1I1IT50_9RHOB|nr:hypothetical protein [Tropicimonas isoalkanivorans]SFC37488.1 hypothetical protein SAMN04488094_104151 [Tropicimonas isoalkanivorans]
MGVLEDLADGLAKDTIEEADRLGREDLITEVAKQLGATSTTMEEAYLTSIRMRLAEKRARQFLENRVRQVENDDDS